MPVYPINLDISGQCCAVIGGGAVGERKVMPLLAAEAEVVVISPILTPNLQALAEQNKLRWVARPYQAGDVADCFLVICATDNAVLNRQVAVEARQSGALVNVVDAPELGNFSVPSQLARGHLLLTVSTGGKSPALARQLRQELSELYGEEYGLYLELLAKIRSNMKAELATAHDRESFWRDALNKEVLNLLADGNLEEAEARMYDAISGTRIKP